LVLAAQERVATVECADAPIGAALTDLNTTRAQDAGVDCAFVSILAFHIAITAIRIIDFHRRTRSSIRITAICGADISIITIYGDVLAPMYLLTAIGCAGVIIIAGDV
tara:strand:- start:281 stop:604 length:324 start_codon:yes stop_codon:yes gene_type:complete